MPQSLTNGAGENNSASSMNIPICQGYRLDSGQMDPDVIIVANSQSPPYDQFPIEGFTQLYSYIVKLIF